MRHVLNSKLVNCALTFWVDEPRGDENVKDFCMMKGSIHYPRYCMMFWPDSDLTDISSLTEVNRDHLIFHQCKRPGL